jgi:hypothetical protein
MKQISTPGESNASAYTGYLGNRTLTGAIAQEIGAATIVLEHRYWGYSSPFPELTTANMQYLTLENSILDLTNFANNVKLPFTRARTNADAVPWVLVGGSYSGALTAWTESVAPGTFWAYLASSAVVEAISDLWTYFDPVQQGMPKNCSSDVSKVIDYMDNVLLHGSKKEQYDLKAKFGLESVEHNDDFMGALENGPWLWQGEIFWGLDFFVSIALLILTVNRQPILQDAVCPLLILLDLHLLTVHRGFFQWCDYIENSVNQTNKALLPGAEGVGVTKALDGYAKWWKEVFFPGNCESYGYFEGTYNTECYNTYNASNPIFTDTSLSNTLDRQWQWMLCNEPFGYWQTGAPKSRPSIVSRLITPEYFQRQCALYFPTGPHGETFASAKGKTEADVNTYTGGWDHVNTTRLVFTNGQYDPWRDATVSADFRPGGPLQSTADVPVNVVPGGFHCSDLSIKNGDVNAGAAKVQQAEIAQIKKFVDQWPGPKKGGYGSPPPKTYGGN